MILSIVLGCHGVCVYATLVYVYLLYEIAPSLSPFLFLFLFRFFFFPYIPIFSILFSIFRFLHSMLPISVRTRKKPSRESRSKPKYVLQYVQRTTSTRVMIDLFIFQAFKSDESDAYASDRCGEGREEEY